MAKFMIFKIFICLRMAKTIRNNESINPWRLFAKIKEKVRKKEVKAKK